MSTDLLTQVRTTSRVWLAVLGLLSVVAGVLILVWPKATGGAFALTVAIVAGIYAIVGGVAYFFGGLFGKEISGWGRVGRILLGILAVVAGVVIIANPSTSAVFVVWWIVLMIGFSWIFEGFQAFSGTSMASSKGWAIFYGIISILAGIAIIVSPLFGALVMWWLVGISAIVWGIVELVAAIRFRV